MDFKTFLRKMKLKIYPDVFPVWFEDMKADGSLASFHLVSKKHLEQLQKKYDLFDEKHFAWVQDGAALARKSPYVRAYINLMYRLVSDRVYFKQLRSENKIPCPQVSGPDLLWDTVFIFPYIGVLERRLEELLIRGVPRDVVVATGRTLDTTLYIHSISYDRPFFDATYFTGWSQWYLDNDILEIGRLGFQMKPNPLPYVALTRKESLETVVLANGISIYRDGYVLGSAGREDEEGAVKADFEETEEGFWGYPAKENGRFSLEKEYYSRDEWEVSLRGGEPILAVHIPRRGSLHPDVCRDAYKRALEIIPRAFPHFRFKALTCQSWMMSPQMEEVVEEPSNLLSFQKPYVRVPCKSLGKAIFSFVFHRPFEKYEDLPENTRLERAMKARVLAGNPFYEGGGIAIVKDGKCKLTEEY